MAATHDTRTLLLCVRNSGCHDLVLRKAYVQLPDEIAAGEGYVRVVDETGEDYLYPADCFVAVEVPTEVARRLGDRS